VNIKIDIIDHKKQRYDTVGDWYYDANGTLHIHVSKLADGRHEHLVAIHELVEALLCEEAGVDEEDVTAFDLVYEANRKAGDTSEPGDSVAAPYYKQHQIATGMEKILAAQMHVDWNSYERDINQLVWKT
jgi:hypothetical protein